MARRRQGDTLWRSQWFGDVGGGEYQRRLLSAPLTQAVVQTSIDRRRMGCHTRWQEVPSPCRSSRASVAHAHHRSIELARGAEPVAVDKERIISRSLFVGHSAIARLRPFAGRVPPAKRNVAVSTSQPRAVRAGKSLGRNTTEARALMSRILRNELSPHDQSIYIGRVIASQFENIAERESRFVCPVF